MCMKYASKFWTQAKSIDPNRIQRFYKIVLDIFHIKQENMDISNYFEKMAEPLLRPCPYLVVGVSQPLLLSRVRALMAVVSFHAFCSWLVPWDRERESKGDRVLPLPHEVGAWAEQRLRGQSSSAPTQANIQHKKGIETLALSYRNLNFYPWYLLPTNVKDQ